MSTTTITRIKQAVDAGLRVTLSQNSNYEVIKNKAGDEYLIAYCHRSMDANYIGLHGREGTKYENEINMSGDWTVSGRIEG